MEKKPAGFLRLGYCGRGCPSPSALRHCRRWSFTRWHPLDFLPAWFLSARAHAIRLFRRLFLNDLEKAFDSGRLRFFGSLEKFSCGTLTSFVATSLRCTKPNGPSMPNRPFAGPQQVLDYVGRYAHRVAISNNRLLDIEHDQVAFQWKDYRHNDRQKKMTLPWRFLWLRLSSRCMNAGHSSFSRKQLVDDRAERSQRPCSDEALPVDKECRRAGHTIAVGVLNVFGNFIGHLAAFDARVELCRVETADCLRHRGYGGEADSSDPLILKYRSVQSPLFIRSLLKGAVGRLGRFFCIRMHI